MIELEKTQYKYKNIKFEIVRPKNDDSFCHISAGGRILVYDIPKDITEKEAKLLLMGYFEGHLQAQKEAKRVINQATYDTAYNLIQKYDFEND